MYRLWVRGRLETFLVVVRDRRRIQPRRRPSRSTRMGEREEPGRGERSLAAGSVPGPRCERTQTNDESGKPITRQITKDLSLPSSRSRFSPEGNREPFIKQILIHHLKVKMDKWLPVPFLFFR